METSRLPKFQERFKELRGDMPQGEFCKKIRISRPTVSLYENGERIPDAEVLRNIAEYCNVSADWLLGLSDIQTANEDMKTAQRVTGLSEKAIKQIRLYNDSTGEPLNPLLESDGFWTLLADIDSLREQDAVLSVFLAAEDTDNIYRLYGDTRLLKFEIIERFSALIESLIPTNQTLAEAKNYTDTHVLGRPIRMNGGAENG